MGINYQFQDQFLDRFFALSLSENFYLTGGTALARFYYHHRESVDLDLFTQNQTQDFNELNLKTHHNSMRPLECLYLLAWPRLDP